MAQYTVPDPEELMECPYDRVHMIRAKRFQYHLMKCRKNYTGKDYVTCPFNAKHEMPKPEIRHHLANCPDKAVIERDLEFSTRKEDDLFKGCTDTPVYKDIHIPSTEDWDEELTEGVSYGPLYDQTYYSRVQFKTMDRTTLGKNQKAIITDERLTVNQKMSELNVNQNGREADDEELRLPKTSSLAARSAQQQPKMQPIQQPEYSVFNYSIGRGRGRAVAPMKNDENRAPFQSLNKPIVGRGMPMNGAPGIGRGLMGGYGRGSVAPPPGFCVPNVNKGQYN